MATARKYRSRQKCYTGCWTCRSRKVKCDEAVPVCQTCTKARRECGGYDSKFVWVHSDNKVWIPHHRRFLRMDLTWKDHATLSSTKIDELISGCDEVEFVHGDQLLNLPFTVWHPSKLQLFQKPSNPIAHEVDVRLFDHYVNHVAALMMPFEDTRNPWKTLYPAMAIQNESNEQKAMLKAMVSQAAFNLVHLGQDTTQMRHLATKYYHESLQLLRRPTCPADSGEFIATALTMVMAEVYSGQNKDWKVHYRGAWNYLVDSFKTRSFAESNEAFVFLQSLAIIKLIQDTSQLTPQAQKQVVSTQMNDHSIIEWLSSALMFGFTIGANNLLLGCIGKITALGVRVSEHPIRFGKEANETLTRLHDNESLGIVANHLALPKREQMLQCHLRVFQPAAIIYFHRVLFDVPPQTVLSYVSQVFENANDFYKLGGGNLSLWPVFIAAVEAYNDCDIETAQGLLLKSINVGMGNRHKIKAVVEQVWHTRSLLSEKTGQAKATITVDWRETMQRLNLDVLLV